MARKQCKKCPWKVGTDPHEIPNGYCETKHAGLQSTIARPGEFRPGGELRLMACHETDGEKILPCAGWLANQLGEGNNIALRLAVITGKLNADIKLDGPQHRTLAATLPKRKRKAK